MVLRLHEGRELTTAHRKPANRDRASKRYLALRAFILVAPGFRRGRAHPKRARRDHNQFGTALAVAPVGRSIAQALPGESGLYPRCLFGAALRLLVGNPFGIFRSLASCLFLGLAFGFLLCLSFGFLLCLSFGFLLCL